MNRRRAPIEQPMNGRGAALRLLLAAVGCLSALPAARGDGVCDEEERRALDFLVGEWRLVSAGEEVGRSRIEKLEDGCLIAETWRFFDGRSGSTYSSFDAAAGAWRRFGVSSAGDLARSEGTVADGELTFDGSRVSADGQRANWRERLTRHADGRIERTVSTSRRATDRLPASAMLFEGHYEPRNGGESAVPVDRTAPEPGAPPSTSPEPEPARATASVPTADTLTDIATGDVKPDSARAVDAAAIERIAMASPMVLRLPLGTVESLPEGYAWTTREMAPYLCDGVTIQRLQVERRTRRGQVELQVELAVHSTYLSRRVEIDVDLHRSGSRDGSEPVASGTATSRVGRGIPEQIEGGAVVVELVLAMDPDVFEAIVAEPERPELVVTLAVGG